MNKKYVITLPLKGRDKPLSLTVHTMLTPLYITEAELLTLFEKEGDTKSLHKAREIAFASGLRAEEYLRLKFRSMNIWPEHLQLLTIELAKCFAINAMANYFYRDFSESLTRSKTLGEFSVSTTTRHSPQAIKHLLDESKACIDEAKQAAEDYRHMAGLGLGLSVVKGLDNIKNKYSWRTWFHNNLPARSEDIYASEKRGYNENMYKGGLDVSKARTVYPQGVRGPSLYR